MLFSLFLNFDSILHLLIYFPLSFYSGETAFRSLSIPYGWAKYPMIHRVKEINASIPMTILYGSRSWMDSSSGHTIKYLREKSPVDIQIIKGAGHHIYADRPVEFNTCVNAVCDQEAVDGNEFHNIENIAAFAKEELLHKGAGDDDT